MWKALSLGRALAALLLVVFLNSPFPVGAQLGIDTQNASGDICDCSPPCEGDGGGVCRGRIVSRDDCPCCKVCAQQEGANCTHPTQPCDTEFGLVCASEGICKGKRITAIGKNNEGVFLPRHQGEPRNGKEP
ncbi:hypothetical protein SK128_023154 [Halocaridina rubra]|uniref:IGFBP N-terminal domain-containing protein n=1 Tax=Halocaridina rubra TaxID=373956 RepID=A0AAN8WXJ6_HALRR